MSLPFPYPDRLNDCADESSSSFTDDEVLSDDFMEKVLEVARVAKPLVQM